MSGTIATATEYREWRKANTDSHHTLARLVREACRTNGALYAHEIYEHLGVSRPCGRAHIAPAIASLVRSGQLGAAAERDGQRYTFLTDASGRRSSTKRNETRTCSVIKRPAIRARRQKALTVAAIRPQAAQARTVDAPPMETSEDFIARGGHVQVLPHSFDTRRTVFPGRRPVTSSTRTNA